MVHNIAIITKRDINYYGSQFVDLSVDELEKHKGKYYEPKKTVKPKIKGAKQC
jgi:hypothetical protein